MSRVLVRDKRLILTFTNGEVIDTVSDDPFSVVFEVTYLDESDAWRAGSCEPETDVHDVIETSAIVQLSTPESGIASSITTDLAYIQEQEDPQDNEGKTPEMSSVTRLVSPRRGDVLEGEMVPYIPSSPVRESSKATVTDEPELENMSERETEEVVWTTGKSTLKVRSPPTGRQPHFPF